MNETIPLKRVAICNQTNLVDYKIKAISPTGKKISEAGGVVGMIFQNRLSDLKPPFIHQLATDKKLPAHLLFKNRLSILMAKFFIVVPPLGHLEQLSKQVLKQMQYMVLKISEK